MSLNPVQPPVIILGMHRSGTSMVTRLVEGLGLFVGRRKDKNHEATFFQGINQWLLAQCGGSWDNPASVRYLLENPEVRSQTIRYLAHSLLESPRLISFLGLKKYLRYRSAYSLNIPWGWKDPRNTFTLPIWLDLFPNAKLVYIQRNGGDVAASLQRRGRMDRWRHGVYRGLGLFHWIAPRRAVFVQSPRCDTLEGGFSLWQEYVGQAAANLSPLRERTLALHYEDILSDPFSSTVALARFCELEVPAARIRAVAAMVNPPSSSTFRSTQGITLPAAAVSQQSPVRFRE